MQDPDSSPRPLDHVALGQRGDAPALVTKATTLSFDALEIAIGRLARALLERAAKGDRVATWLPKTIDSCLMPVACARAGLVHVPVNPVLKRAQVRHILHDSGSVLLLTSASRAASLEDGDLPEGCAVWDEAEAALMRESGDALPPSDHDPAELCAIMYTSGSTGRPKGVVLSHANLWLGAVSVAHYLGITPEDRTLSVLPLGFDYGQNQLFSTWKGGGAVYPFDFLLPKELWRALDTWQITTLAAVPPLWLQLVEAEAPPALSVRRITNSGGALTPRMIDRLRPRFPNADIYPMYGLTEAFRSTYLPPALVATHPSSMGRAIPFADVMVVAPDGSEAAIGQPGELVHAGPLVAQGYWHDPERTAERYKLAPEWSKTGGMAVWSGDTVMRDAEGLLYFVARDDEMIKSSGHRISPLEIEEAAIGSGVVAEAVAHAIPDPALGQAIRLVVRGDAARATDLAAHLKRELPGHMQPKLVDWRDALPRNANGKIDRSAIRAEAA